MKNNRFAETKQMVRGLGMRGQIQPEIMFQRTVNLLEKDGKWNRVRVFY